MANTDVPKVKKGELIHIVSHPDWGKIAMVPIAKVIQGSRKKRNRRQSTASRSSASSDSSFDLDSDEDILDSPPSKRLRASELQVCRYNEEFQYTHYNNQFQHIIVPVLCHRWLDRHTYLIGSQFDAS